MHKKPINKKIQSDKWYLVDTINNKEPRLIRSDFKNKQDVIDFIEEKLDGDLRWDYISGIDAKDNKLKFKRKLTNTNGVPVTVYKYPPDCITLQDRKSYRTQFRRNEKTQKKK